MPQGVTDSVIEPAPGEGRAKPAGRERWRRRIPGFATLAVFAALALYVLASQNRFVGFEPGYDERQPRHHGWVSSHALAIISHATAENGFVGYALAYAEPNGTIRYDYFDRYPVFFSAAMHQALSITERLSSKVYIAKQIMNLIFLATVFFAALIVDKLVGSKPAALAAAVLAMSSEYLLFYKDMVHFDQPALLGMMILVYTLALYRIDGRRRAPYLGTVLAVSMGRGYASFSVLLVWLVLGSGTAAAPAAAGLAPTPGGVPSPPRPAGLLAGLRAGGRIPGLQRWDGIRPDWGGAAPDQHPAIRRKPTRVRPGLQPRIRRCGLMGWLPARPAGSAGAMVGPAAQAGRRDAPQPADPGGGACGDRAAGFPLGSGPSGGGRAAAGARFRVADRHAQHEWAA